MIDFLIFFTGLISVVNPIGIIPIWIALSSELDHTKRLQLKYKVILNFILVLVFVLLLGKFIFSFFGITIPAIRLAGSIMIFSSAMELLSGGRNKKGMKAISSSSIAFSPLTVPMLVGPGTIGMMMSQTEQLSSFWTSEIAATSHLIILGAILLVSLIITVVLTSSFYLMKLLGEGGIVAMSKVMGFILLSISVQHAIIAIGDIVKMYISSM
jgi:multiple antibiotic resistance protein